MKTIRTHKHVYSEQYDGAVGDRKPDSNENSEKDGNGNGGSGDAQGEGQGEGQNQGQGEGQGNSGGLSQNSSSIVTSSNDEKPPMPNYVYTFDLSYKDNISEAEREFYKPGTSIALTTLFRNIQNLVGQNGAFVFSDSEEANSFDGALIIYSDNKLTEDKLMTIQRETRKLGNKFIKSMDSEPVELSFIEDNFELEGLDIPRNPDTELPPLKEFKADDFMCNESEWPLTDEEYLDLRSYTFTPEELNKFLDYIYMHDLRIRYIDISGSTFAKGEYDFRDRAIFYLKGNNIHTQYATFKNLDIQDIHITDSAFLGAEIIHSSLSSLVMERSVFVNLKVNLIENYHYNNTLFDGCRFDGSYNNICGTDIFIYDTTIAGDFWEVKKATEERQGACNMTNVTFTAKDHFFDNVNLRYSRWNNLNFAVDIKKGENSQNILDIYVIKDLSDELTDEEIEIVKKYYLDTPQGLKERRNRGIVFDTGSSQIAVPFRHYLGYRASDIMPYIPLYIREMPSFDSAMEKIDKIPWVLDIPYDRESAKQMIMKWNNDNKMSLIGLVEKFNGAIVGPNKNINLRDLEDKEPDRD